jgi:hypothetical protein
VNAVSEVVVDSGIVFFAAAGVGIAGCAAGAASYSEEMDSICIQSEV